MADEQFNPVQFLLSAASVASFAGLAALLRSGRRVTWLAVLSAMLNSALVGLAIATLWFTKFRDANDPYFLIGVCILAGLGGNTLLEFGLAVLRNGGININVTHDGSKPRADQGDKDHDTDA
jgi:hypothetical protein